LRSRLIPCGDPTMTPAWSEPLHPLHDAVPTHPQLIGRLRGLKDIPRMPAAELDVLQKMQELTGSTVRQVPDTSDQTKIYSCATVSATSRTTYRRSREPTATACSWLLVIITCMRLGTSRDFRNLASIVIVSAVMRDLKFIGTGGVAGPTRPPQQGRTRLFFQPVIEPAQQSLLVIDDECVLTKNVGTEPCPWWSSPSPEYD